MPEDRMPEPRKTSPGSQREKQLLSTVLYAFLSDPRFAGMHVSESGRMELKKIYRDLAAKHLPLCDFNISTWAENVASV